LLRTLSPVGTEQLTLELGPESRGIGVTQVVPFPWSNVVSVVREYQKLSDKGVYSYYGMEGYLMAKTMVEGLTRSGRDLTRENLVNSLESLNNADLGGYRINFGPASRLGSHMVELTVIGQDGKHIR